MATNSTQDRPDNQHQQEILPAQPTAEQYLHEILKTLTRLFGQVDSKKFWVFLVATYFTYTGLLPASAWLTIGLIYMGVEGALDWRAMYETVKQQRPQDEQTAQDPRRTNT